MKSAKKKFLKLPEYPGGKEAFKAYIKSNLVYPEEALKQGVEGIVYLSAEINAIGDVQNVIVEKRLGAGCDEEAIRLIENVRFGGVKNRGVRVRALKKFKIEFKLPCEYKIKYHMISKNESSDELKNTQKYTYSVSLNNKSKK